MAEKATISFTIDGSEHLAVEGTSVAAALLNAGITRFQSSLAGEPRAPLCGMGICFECRVRINGTNGVRSCLEPVCEGMEVETGD